LVHIKYSNNTGFSFASTIITSLDNYSDKWPLHKLSLNFNFC